MHGPEWANAAQNPREAEGDATVAEPLFMTRSLLRVGRVDAGSGRAGRHLFCLTDSGSQWSCPLPQAIESAQRADTLVYSILFARDEGPPQSFRRRRQARPLAIPLSLKARGPTANPFSNR